MPTTALINSTKTKSPFVGVSRPSIKKVSTKPFLKWVGGKTQLLEELKKYVPQDFNRYIEPFVGGGALFFDLAPQKAIINDANEELMNTYAVLRDSVDELIDELAGYVYEKNFYYEMRAKDPSELSKIERAARTIYLNKTCFNGIYRVNKKGQFNVPMGRYANPTICDEEKLRAAHLALQDVIIECDNYMNVLMKHAKEGDFIYIDPPYHPVGKYSDFKRYTKDFFYKEDQVALRKEILELKDRGCFVMASNSHCDFILDLYKDFDINVVHAKRYINKNASGRGAVKEVIIL